MMPFEDVQVQLVDTPAVTDHHAEPYMVNLAHGADGVLLVLDVGDGEAASAARALARLIERARVWPAVKARTPDLPDFVASRPIALLANKSDQDEDGVLAGLVREAVTAAFGVELPSFEVSAENGAGLEDLRRYLWSELRRIRVYAKEPGKKPDLERPFVLRTGATVYDLALHVHKDIAERLKYARIWGHARFDGQQVDRDHVLYDRDVVELHG
jgi:ribosome-interacting GTPase 1